jgi:large subunit ribosomal protein L15
LAEIDFEGVEINPETMTIAGLIKKPTDPVVVLGDGDIYVAIHVKAHRFSKTAQEKIEAAGGTVEIIPFA